MSFYGNNEKENYGCREKEDKCEKDRDKKYEKEYEKDYEYEDCDCRFARHLRKFVGETVTVFTASGGVSGCGFTGFLIDVNCCFIRLVNKQGTEPTCPLGSSCCCEKEDGKGDMQKQKNYYTVGSVTDIPVDKIVAFTHNAV